MAQVPMYPNVPGRPFTKTTAAYKAGTDTQITVADTSKLLAPPNYVTIEREDGLQFVTVKYTSKSGNTISGITVEEAQDNASKTATYPASSIAYRAHCNIDVLAMQNNIRDLDARIPPATFGWDIDMSLSSPTAITYTGELSGKTQTQRADYIDKFFEIAVVKNGKEQYLLDKSNWNNKKAGGAANITGTDGDVMLRIAKLYTLHYFLPSLNGGGRVICFRASKDPFENAKARAHTWLDGDERSYLYLGVFEGTDSSGALMSVYSTTATPKVNIRIDAFRAMTTATLKGGDYYGIMNMNTKTLWNDLYLCIYGNRNTQAACGNGLVGLSAASPVGVAAILTSGMTYGTTANSTTHVKVMHTVNPHGNVWEMVDGFIIFAYRVYVNPHAGGMINLCPNNANVTEAAVQEAGYELVSSEACPTNGYVTQVSGNDGMPYLPTAVGGASTTHFCDCYWQAGSTQIARAGGLWGNGTACGAFYLNLSDAPSAAWAGGGARLQMLSAV